MPAGRGQPLIALLAPLGLLAILASCQASEGAEAGALAPAFAATDLDGRLVSLSDYHGDVVMLNIWATWCLPCRREMPALDRLHREQAGEGLRVVGVSIDAAASRPEIDRFLEQHDITFQVLHDPDQRALATFETTGVPETFLIGRDGRVLRRWTGLIDPLSPSIRAQIDAALRG
jgi:cytochrome c biogenesis protein CcmG, thiol:disulfide interchange protein DsbE